MRAAILQSNYIPWKGYFDVISQVDRFVIYDDVQYTKNDWRNRNLIKTPNGLLWLTIPIQTSGKFGQRICDAVVAGQSWRKKHWKSIAQFYKDAKYFKEFSPKFENAYLGTDDTNLSRINFKFIQLICDILEIKTAFHFSTEFSSKGDKIERIIGICKELGVTHYLSGPAAKNYLVGNEYRFKQEGIELKYKVYSYPTYPQLYGTFFHNVSVIDVIFNTGLTAKNYIRSVRDDCDTN